MMMTMILLSFVVLFATCITLQAFEQRKRLLEEKKRREEQEREHKRRRIEELSKSSRRGRSSAAEMSGDGGGDGGGTVDGSGSNDSGNSNRNSSTHSGNDENASVPDHSIPQSAATSPCIASSTQSENQTPTADNTTASGSIIPAKPIIPFSLRYKFPTKFRQAALDKLIEAQISCGVDRQYAIDCALQKEMDLYNQFSSRNVYWSSAMRLAQRIARSEETLSLHQEDQVSDVVEAQSEQQESESSLDLAATLAETNSGEINIAEPSSKT